MEACVKENEALRNLALILFEEGEVARPYRYYSLSLEDANFYNARLRRMEIARTHPLIDKAYQQSVESKRQQLRFFLMITTVFALLLALGAVSLYRKNVELGRVRKRLEESNGKLEVLNNSLREANKVKEIYIGHFLGRCSDYIDKLNKYIRQVSRKLSEGKIAELHAMVRSSQMMDYEVSEFYHNFDMAFLKIYPDFVEKVNELLIPEERIVLKNREMLNSELRTLALIRLGIKESSDIARFLRYSVNTVYTYRTKVKNKSYPEIRKDFEEELMKIGLP
ncbi:MAG: DUF6377 domain-containing protein [Bacteroides sp.]|nr:DUF6377 domain-containing protein [Bacteroides sp.]